MKRLSVLVAAVATVVGFTSPAQAIQIPFDEEQTVEGQNVDVSGNDVGSGLVGVCDFQLQCTGFSVRVANDPASAGVTDTTVSVAGAVCIFDESAPCGSAGNPFTGVVFTRRYIDTPEVYSTRIKATVEVCYWILAPRDYPTKCIPPIPVDSEGAATPGVGNLGELIPASTGLSFDA